MDKYQRAIYEVRQDLRCLSREVKDVSGVTEIEVNNLIQQAPVNANTQAEIDGLQQQIDNIETGGDTPPSFSDSNEFQI